MSAPCLKAQTNSPCQDDSNAPSLVINGTKLFEAIEVANAAFIENNALNEEAERRYETLVSEIIKGKNVLKGEILDFGLDNIETGTNAIRQLNNALLTVVQGLRVMLQNSLQTFSVIVGGVVAIKAFSTNLSIAREAMGMYAHKFSFWPSYALLGYVYFIDFVCAG